MNLTSPTQVRWLLESIGVQPSRSLGQNFLVDKNILDVLLKTVEVEPDDIVLEIGPGLGVVTIPLAEKAARVIAIEKDRRLYDYLAGRLADSPRVELICADALRIEISDLLSRGVSKVVSNLPFSVGGRILVRFLTADMRPRRMTVTVQLEVAKRLTASPGSKDYGLLSIWSQLVYDIRIAKVISPTCFWPQPKVKAAIVTMTRAVENGIALKDKAFFYRLTKHVFSYRRKQMATILGKAPRDLRCARSNSKAILDEIGVRGDVRPEDLSVRQWCLLANRLDSEPPFAS